MVLSLLSLTSLGIVHASTAVHRDTGNEVAQSPPAVGQTLSMYRGIALGSCSFTDPNVPPADTYFPANTPFHTRHGWVTDFPSLNGTDKGAFMGQITRFELYVDGKETSPLNDWSMQSDGRTFLKLFISNSNNGMTGTHVFVGWWFIDAGLNGDGPYGTQDFVLGCALRVHFT
jgi:hypothetical protein